MAKSLSLLRNLLNFHLMFFSSISFSSQLHLERESEESGVPCSASNQYDYHLSKLEDLVRNLERIVTKLDSKPPASQIDDPSIGDFNRENTSPVAEALDVTKHDSEKHVDEDPWRESIDKEAVGRPVLVSKYSPFWSERFHFVSAVRLDYPASSMNVLPFRDVEGMSKYVVVGDQRGMIYILLRNGDVFLDFHTNSSSTVTSMLSYISVHKNESVLITGHGNGEILMHRLWERSNGEEWNSLEIETIRTFPSHDLGEEGSHLPSAVIILEIHHVGRVRYILSSNSNGRISVFNENGNSHGSATPSRKPLAFLKQRLLFLTEVGAGSLDLRTMKIKETECEGLNNSVVTNYVFDATERSKAYGFTSKSDLVHVLLFGDTSNFKCKVRSKKKVVDMDEPLFFHTIKGYLLIVNREKAYVYNVSSQHYIRTVYPRLLFSVGLEFIREPFLDRHTSIAGHNPRKTTPLVVSDREKLIALTLGEGHVGLYRSNLPVFKGEVNSMLWTSPALFFLLFLFGAWQFFAKKRAALTSWGSDDMFAPSPPESEHPQGSERRGDGLRASPNRYISPPKYPAGAAESFRDHSPRIASVISNFRAAAEMKFRGSNLDSTNFQKRRDDLFSNSRVVDGGGDT